MRTMYLRAAGKCQLRSALCIILIFAIGLTLWPDVTFCEEERRITDMAGRTMTIPQKANRVICYGSGCL